MKVCTRCGEEKDFGAFNKRSKAKDGLQRWCRACARAYHKANKARAVPQKSRAAKSKEEIRAKRREYYVRTKERDREKNNQRSRERYWADPEKARAYSREWAAAHPQNVRVYNSAHYEANKEEIRQKERERREANPGQSRAAARRYRARLAGVRGEDVREEVLAFRDPLCYLCGGEFTEEDTVHLDHKIPLSRTELSPTHC